MNCFCYISKKTDDEDINFHGIIGVACDGDSTN